jgi:uncharacterized RDD family membrane protein YckC
MTDAEPGPVRRSLLSRTVAGSVLAARGMVEDRLVETAQGVVDDLEPYLAAETVPRIVDALVPHLVEHVVPQILVGINEHLAATTVPGVLGARSPELTEELLPAILEELRPYLEARLVPALVDAVTPHLVESTVPTIVDGLMPRVISDLVPAILDGISDEPRIRDLVRQQSFGLVLEATERFRRLLADADDVVERLLRRLLFVRRPVQDALPPPDRPPARTRSHAGVVSRLVGSAVDILLVSFLVAQALSAVVAVLDVLLTPVPVLLVTLLTVGAGAGLPLYLALAWCLTGRTIGGLVGGYSVVARDGSRLGLVGALARGVLSVTLFAVWVPGMLAGVFDPARRGLLDRITRSRTPYRVVRPTLPGLPGPLTR